MTQAIMAEVKVRTNRNFFAFMFFMQRVRPKSQVKTPNSFNAATRIIIPIRKNIISQEEDNINSSSVAIPVKSIMDEPRKAKLKRNSQKRIAPKIVMAKMPETKICSVLKPISLPESDIARAVPINIKLL